MPGATAGAALSARSPTCPGSLLAPLVALGLPVAPPPLWQAVHRPPVGGGKMVFNLSIDTDSQVANKILTSAPSSPSCAASSFSFSPSLLPLVVSCALVCTDGALGAGLTRKMSVLMQVELIFASWGGEQVVLAVARHNTDV